MAVLGLKSFAEVGMFATSLVVGVTMVMGVNAVNSAPSFMLDYYKYIDKDPDAAPKYPTFWNNVLNFYTVVTLVAQTIHEPTNLTSFMCRFSLLFRLEVSSVLMIVELLVILLLPHTGATEAGAIGAMVVVAYLGGAARAYFENTGYALFGPCPSKYLSGMLIGSAVSGALVSVIQIILRVAMPDTYDAVLTQSVVYFTMSIAIIFFAALLLIGLLYNPYARRYIAEFRSRRSPIANIYRPLKRKAQAMEGGDDGAAGHAVAELMPDGGNVFGPDDDDILFDDRVPVAREGDAATAAADPAAASEVACEPACCCGVSSSSSSGGNNHHHQTQQQQQVKTKNKQLNSHLDGAYGELEEDNNKQISSVEDADGSGVDPMDRDGLTTSELLQGVALWPVLKAIYPMMFSCVFTFLVTYLMYPGMLLAVDPDDGWYTTLIMTTYNFGDLIGRVLSMWKRLWPPRKVIVIGSLCRVAFVPLLVLCATGTIPGHAPAYVFTALLALSNGFFGTLSMVYSPETPSLTTDGERAMAGQATGVCLLLGCSVGSLIQLAEVIPFN